MLQRYKGENVHLIDLLSDYILITKSLMEKVQFQMRFKASKQVGITTNRRKGKGSSKQRGQPRIRDVASQERSILSDSRGGSC